MFKKSDILRMNEAEFQTKVLIPLFRKMGFHDVTPFGGGTLERGKDIVMWKDSELGQRLNYGVVVKAKKITGNAETNAGAMNVLNQVRQMLKTAYLNPVNGQQESIHRCFVACSKDITKEAMHSIEGELDNDLEKLVEWIHPKTNLFDLIERYLPEQTIFETLASTQTQLDELMKSVPYRIVGDTDNNFTFKTKDGKSMNELPFTIGGRFTFDTKTKEGKEELDKFQEHLKTGAPIEISGKNIDSFTLPDFLPDFLRPAVTEDAKLILKPVSGQHRLPLNISALSSTGYSATIDFVDMVSVQQGTEQIILANENQAVPWRVKITVGFKSKRINFEFKFDFDRPNVTIRQELDCLKFMRCMNHGGRIAVRSLEMGAALFEGEIKPISDLKVSDNWIELLETLVFIQEKTKQVFFKNNKFSVSKEEYTEIARVAEITKSGRTFIASDSLDLSLDVEQVKSVLDKFGDGAPTTLTYKPEDFGKEIIWNTEVDLGEFIIFQTVYLKKTEIRRLKKELAKAKNGTRITVRFNYEKERSYSELIYINWVPEEERKELIKTPMFPKKRSSN